MLFLVFTEVYRLLSYEDNYAQITLLSLLQLSVNGSEIRVQLCSGFEGKRAVAESLDHCAVETEDDNIKIFGGLRLIVFVISAKKN